jgi:CheY-like chemotaxis protein
MDKRPRILCVDDEPNVLEGLSLHLRKGFDVEVASGGREALARMAQREPFAVVLSDMRMPEMDGAALLATVRKEFPEVVRMLLTGHADVSSAAAAVNEGQVFRFLTKPITPDQLRAAVAAAVEQHRLQVAERVLLEQTLRGSVQALIDVLALGNPVAFGHVARVWTTAQAVAQALGVDDGWQLEVAAKLSHLGVIVLPDPTLERWLRGAPLTAEEHAIVARVPAMSVELIAHIPRLENVRALIVYAMSDDPARALQDVPMPLRAHATVLRAAVEFEKAEREGLDDAKALERLTVSHHHEPVVLDALAKRRRPIPAPHEGAPHELPLSAVRVGMVVTEDVCTAKGVLLIARGNALTHGAVERLRNYPRGFIREPIKVVERHG